MLSSNGNNYFCSDAPFQDEIRCWQPMTMQHYFGRHYQTCTSRKDPIGVLGNPLAFAAAPQSQSQIWVTGY